MVVEKIEKTRQLLKETIDTISSNGQEWAKFLNYANKFYKYSFEEQVLIFAQRPEATACASYDLWNNHFGRYIKKGSRGIGLLTVENDAIKLRYVFDVADTKSREREQAIKLWSFDAEKHQGLLQRTFSEISSSETESFIALISEIADNYVEAANMPEVSDEGKRFTAQSVGYMVARRCGLSDESFIEISPSYFDVIKNLSPAEFLSIANETAHTTETILRNIEKSITNVRHHHNEEERGIADGRQINHGENGDELQARGGLSYSRPRTAGAERNRPLREDEAQIFGGTSEGRIQSTDIDAQIEPALGRDGRESARDGGEHHGSNVGEGPSSGQSDGHAGLGRAYEQNQEPSRGNDVSGTDLSGGILSGEIVSEDDEFAADEALEPSSLNTNINTHVQEGQLSLFPTEEEQISSIEQAASQRQQMQKTPSISAVSPEDIDMALLKRRPHGSNYEIYKILTNTSISAKDAAKEIQQRYGIAGGGTLSFGDGRNYGWFDYSGKGIEISDGRGSDRASVQLSWPGVCHRYKELIKQGKFINENEIAIREGYYKPDPNLSSISENDIKSYISYGCYTAQDNIQLYKLARENKRYSELSPVNYIHFKHATHSILYRSIDGAKINVQSDNEGVLFTKDNANLEFKTWDELYEIFRTKVLQGDYFSNKVINRVYDQYADIVDFLDSYCAPAWPTEETPTEMTRNLIGMFSPQNIGTTILESGEKVVFTPSGNGISLEFKLETGKTETKFYTYHDAAEAFFFIKSQEHKQEQTIRIESEQKEQKNEREIIPTAENDSDTQRQDVGRTVMSHTQNVNYIITDESQIGLGTSAEKARNNIAAIRLLKDLEKNKEKATSEQQEVLARYVGWGGLANVFDENNSTGWQATTKQELKELLTEKEYRAARASTLTAFYTPPSVVRGIYKGLRQMGFGSGNILEPSMGAGNFFGLLPEDMSNSKLYGVELDEITGQIATQLYQKADVSVCGFEDTSLPDNFFDVAVGNVPFGGFKVSDRAYDKHNFLIHDYFFAKTLDKVRPGGVIAFMTSKGTLDKANPSVRRYIAQRAELLGAIRLPNNTMLANAGTEVTSDILFLQKRERLIDIEPNWIYTAGNSDGIPMNQYFIDNPHMLLGKMVKDKSMYGNDNETACIPFPNSNLEEDLHELITQHIYGNITNIERDNQSKQNEHLEYGEAISADPNVRNYSFTVVNGAVYYRENSTMDKIRGSLEATDRIKKLVELRDLTRTIIEYQLNNYEDDVIKQSQQGLSATYDKFVTLYGHINDQINEKLFHSDSGYFLLCALENLDENGNFVSKADLFTKRTIRGKEIPERVDTSMEALILSITEKACVDLEYMSRLTEFTEEKIIDDLHGAIYKDPEMVLAGAENYYVTQDQYLSGNIREKLVLAQQLEEMKSGQFNENIEALKRVMPEEISAAEIDVRLGATWINQKYINQFIKEVFNPASRSGIEAKFISFDSSWTIQNKNWDSRTNPAVYVTYGTSQLNAYEILESSLNLRDVRVYKTVIDPYTMNERRIVDTKETAFAQQKQEAVKECFKEWIFKDPARREELTKEYNRIFNSIRPREFNGSNIKFFGMNPEITLAEHQKDAIARIILGGNTLLAHEVGAGKTFEMAGGVMETKRLGISHKSLWVVPNHLTEQTATEVLKLYPAANILVATKKDFETKNRKKFCSRIATSEFDAVIIGFSQFEKIPISKARQERLLTEQTDELTAAIETLKREKGERVTIKRMEKTRKTLELRLDKLNDQSRKDDVVTFEELGIDRLVIDEAHNYKNLFYHTKMRNVAGLAQTEAKKSTDLYLKCRYMDEITKGQGIVFATGTPISNTMAEMYTMMSYLQDRTLRKMGLKHFDSWASTFGETTTAIELSPEGTGYRAKTRFSKFFNLPELMSVFKETADIKTADQLNLPRPEAVYHTISVEPTDFQKQLMESLSERATLVHNKAIPPEEDNMLKITTDGRKIGLDQRLYDPQLPDQPGTKVNVCVDNVFKIWEEGSEKRLTQLVFCDFSTPSKNRFNLYDDVKEKLLAKGIPEKEVAFIHDADNEQKKKELFAKVRAGQVRVLMGSTSKMGAGTNIQDRLVALHDLDCPWRPADLEQRAGRIVRQGNENEKVDIYRYVTKDTFDAYLYQTLENKQKFISQVMTSKTPLRSCEDMDESVLQYSEIKALCAGDPRIKAKMDLDIKVAKLRLAKNSHTNALYALEDNLFKKLPATMKDCEDRITSLENDLASRNKNTNEDNQEKFSGMLINDKFATTKESAGTAILEAAEKVEPGELLPIGQYRGFHMCIGYSPINKYFFIELKNDNGLRHQVGLGTDTYGNITRLNNTLNSIDTELEGYRLRLEEYKKETVRCEEEMKKPFLFEQELKEATARLSQLDIELNLDMARDSTTTNGNYSSEYDPAQIDTVQNFTSQNIFPAQHDRFYKGKIIAIEKDKIFQEIAPGVIVEHRRDAVKTIGQTDIGKEFLISYDRNGTVSVKQVSLSQQNSIER